MGETKFDLMSLNPFKMFNDYLTATLLSIRQRDFENKLLYFDFIKKFIFLYSLLDSILQIVFIIMIFKEHYDDK